MLRRLAQFVFILSEILVLALSIGLRLVRQPLLADCLADDFLLSFDHCGQLLQQPVTGVVGVFVQPVQLVTKWQYLDEVHVRSVALSVFGGCLREVAEHVPRFECVVQQIQFGCIHRVLRILGRREFVSDVRFSVDPRKPGDFLQRTIGGRFDSQRHNVQRDHSQIVSRLADADFAPRCFLFGWHLARLLNRRNHRRNILVLGCDNGIVVRGGYDMPERMETTVEQNRG